jgi:hypothetical protein
MNKLKDNAHWAALVAVVLSIFAVTFTVTDQPTPNGGHQKTYTFKVDRSGAPGAQPQTVTVPQTAVAQVQPALESHLQDESPPGTTPQQTAAIDHAQQQIKATLPALPTAGATQGVPGCRTQFVVNQSSRHGVRPTQFWLHYTVSHNVPGWSDVEAVVHEFNTPSFSASSNFVIDAEGHCAYIVPIEAKAWTQAGSNAFAISFEIIDYGNESTYVPPPGLAKLRSVLAVLSKRTGIPLRRGRVANCTPAVSGIVNHADGGICSGGHHDIEPFSVDQVIKQIVAGLRPAKKTVWIRHRQAVHVAYQRDCKRRAQRRAHAPQCAGLRVRARALDRLIARRS